MFSLFIDEDSLWGGLVRGLRANGINVLTAEEAGRLGLDDEDHLAFAASQGRAVYTCNVGHFAALHTKWLQAGAHHAGIIVLPQQLTPIGVQLRALLRLAEAMGEEGVRDQLIFLSNWMAE